MAEYVFSRRELTILHACFHLVRESDMHIDMCCIIEDDGESPPTTEELDLLNAALNLAAKRRCRMPERTALQQLLDKAAFGRGNFVNVHVELVAALKAEHDALLRRAEEAEAKLEAAWNYIEHGWEIEPRSYFEEKYGKDALYWACHYVWKRNPKVESALALTPPEALEQQRERIRREVALEFLAEWNALAKWVRTGEGYRREDARDEIARVVENYSRELEKRFSLDQPAQQEGRDA